MSWPTVAPETLRAAAILTNGAVASSVLDCRNANQVTVAVNFTLGSLTNMLIKVQLSNDKTNWYDYEIDDVTNAVVASTALNIPARSLQRLFDGSCSLAFQVPVKAAYLRLSVLGTGTVTSSSCDITAFLGVA